MKLILKAKGKDSKGKFIWTKEDVESGGIKIINKGKNNGKANTKSKDK